MIGYIAATTVTSNAARKAHTISAGRIIRRLGASGFPDSGGDWPPLATILATSGRRGCRSSGSEVAAPLGTLPSSSIMM